MKTVKKTVKKYQGGGPIDTGKANRGDRMVARGEKKLERVESKRLDRINKAADKAKSKLTKAEKKAGDNPTYRQAKKVENARTKEEKAYAPIGTATGGGNRELVNYRRVDRGYLPTQDRVASEENKRKKAQQKIEKGKFISNRIDKKKESKASSKTMKKGGPIKMQAGGEPLIGTQPPKKSYKETVSSKPNSKDEALKKFKNSMKKQSKSPYQLNPESRTKKLMQKGGATGVGKSTRMSASKQETMPKKPLTPKAMYGTSMKPSMMKKGGAKKK
jgi:hypothetical protein